MNPDANAPERMFIVCGALLLTLFLLLILRNMDLVIDRERAEARARHYVRAYLALSDSLTEAEIDRNIQGESE